MSTVLHEAMALYSFFSTGSSQNQPTGSFQSQPGSFENQTLKRKRKRGIAALLEDTTNLPVSVASENLERRASKEKAESRITVFSTTE